jgi:hypothetical protein
MLTILAFAESISAFAESIAAFAAAIAAVFAAISTFAALLQSSSTQHPAVKPSLVALFAITHSPASSSNDSLAWSADATSAATKRARKLAT